MSLIPSAKCRNHLKKVSRRSASRSRGILAPWDRHSNAALNHSAKRLAECWFVADVRVTGQPVPEFAIVVHVKKQAEHENESQGERTRNNVGNLFVLQSRVLTRRIIETFGIAGRIDHLARLRARGAVKESAPCLRSGVEQGAAASLAPFANSEVIDRASLNITRLLPRVTRHGERSLES
jgi:hypothetical protein